MLSVISVILALLLPVCPVQVSGTGFEKLDEEPGAQTSSKKYINDKSSTSSITSYEGTHPFTADQILSEKVIDDFVSIGKLRKTGGDAERSLVRVDLDKPVESKENTFLSALAFSSNFFSNSAFVEFKDSCIA